MAVYTGVLKMIGTSRDYGRNLGSEYSVVEIGDNEVRNLQVSDLMDSYLRLAVGKEIDALVTFGNSPSRKRLLALRIDGRVRKDNFGFYYGAVAACIALATPCLAGGLFLLSIPFAALALISLKIVLDLSKFS